MLSIAKHREHNSRKNICRESLFANFFFLHVTILNIYKVLLKDFNTDLGILLVKKKYVGTKIIYYEII